MKSNLFLIVIIAVALTSCNTHKKELALLTSKSDSLQKQLADRDQSVNGFLSSMNEIEQNLASIKEKEHMISVSTANKKGEMKQDVKDKINSDIKDIYSMLIKNKKLIASLNKKMKESNLKMDEFQKMIDNLTKSVNEKDEEINTLKAQLVKYNSEIANLNSNVENLTEVTKNQQAEITAKTNELNTAYYIVGTKQELKEKKVITKEGGFIGLGKVAELKNTADWKNFTQIDVTKITTIPVNKKKIKIITTHPEGSFKIEEADNMVKDILITNAKDFWSVSKYLVVIVK